MKPAITYNGKPLTETRGLDEYYDGELDYMVKDTIDQLEQIRNNEIAPDTDTYGVDAATD